jgi:hypothetical protein
VRRPAGRLWAFRLLARAWVEAAKALHVVILLAAAVTTRWATSTVLGLVLLIDAASTPLLASTQAITALEFPRLPRPQLVAARRAPRRSAVRALHGLGDVWDGAFAPQADLVAEDSSAGTRRKLRQDRRPVRRGVFTRRR